jgi:hypothetical protein
LNHKQALSLPNDSNRLTAVARFSFRPSSSFLLCLAVLLAAWHALLAVSATAEKSVTADEIGHLTAGQAYNTRADYRLQPENGNLPQRWAALPFTLGSVSLPSATHPAWKAGNVWNYGHVFFYEEGHSTDEWLYLSRAMIALVSAGTGLLVFFWSKAFFGWRGGFLSLALYAFCPTFLAHGALATSDLVMTFFFLASVGAWWCHLQKPGFSNATLSAVLLGLAAVAKFSAVLLAPMYALIALVWLMTKERDARQQGLLRLARTVVVHVGVAWAVIWMFYGFRYRAFAPDFLTDAKFYHGWDFLLVDLGWPKHLIELARHWHLLPEAWLYGFTFVLQFSHARGAFLNGEHSLTGWTSFFPIAFLIKTTLPLLLLLAATAFLAVRRATAVGLKSTLERARPFTPLLALFLVYWATSLTSHLNIGHRHILPTYPVLFIGVGWLGRWIDFRRPFATIALLGLVGWHISESQWIRPHYLAYFNETVGGPANGWKHLVDSSLDWGQDLPGLKRWLDKNNSGTTPQPVFLSYFGTGEPDYEGIVATRLPMLPDFGRPYPHRRLSAGIYCVSATQLQQVYAEQPRWSLEQEQEYQALRNLEPEFFGSTESRRAAPVADLSKQWKRYERLRFARLCAYLQVRGPDASVGYSILIFKLSASEIQAATASSLDDWRALLEIAPTTHATQAR